MIEAVLWDMDGVLIDSEPLNDEHLEGLLRSWGVSVSARELEQLRGQSTPALATFLTERYGISKTPEEIILEERASYYDFLVARRERLIPTPGSAELVSSLHAEGFSSALVSSASPKRVELFLDCLGLRPYFKVVVDGDCVPQGRGKPMPDIYLFASQMLNVPPQRCMGVEDSTHGITAVKSAGMWCVGYAGLPHNKQDLSGADLVISHFNEINSRLIRQHF